MNKIRTSIFYVTVISIFSAFIYWIILKGEELEQGRHVVHKMSEPSLWFDFISSIHHNLTHPFAVLLAQVVIIIFVARLFSWISNKIGQPAVVGEIVAGIVLGPSLMGLYLPEVSAVLFPANSLSNLTFLSQVGLIMFMFVVGMELDLNILRNKAHEAVVISHASIIIPFALGVGFAFYIYKSFAPEGVQFLSFGLFMGIAMSITAFPVLARIVQERGIHKTRLGTVVITCAAADDITAWCILAAVIAIAQAGSFLSSLLVIALAVLYVLVMIKIVRPFLKRVGDLHTAPEKLSKSIVAIFFVTLILSAYTTEIIGIHALFGAFMAGTIMPSDAKFRNIFIEKVEDIAVVLLLPLFFVFTGLRTQIGLLNDPYAWKVAGLVIIVAVVGKFVGSALAARFVGQSWRDSLTIGALMNTRGLMELVVLNIGYDMGILTPEIFAMMVIMALVTTFMTGPILNFINWVSKSKEPEVLQPMVDGSAFKILLSFNTPDTGRTLLKLSNNLVKNIGPNVKLTAMSLTKTNELYPLNIENYEKESLEPVIDESDKLNLEITTLFKVSNNIGSDIAEVANIGDYDLLLTGMGYSIFEGTLLGRMLGFTSRIINPGRLINTLTGKESLFDKYMFDEQTQNIISRTHVPVGILIDKNLQSADRLFVPIFDNSDIFLLKYISYLLSEKAQLIISDPLDLLNKQSDSKEILREKVKNKTESFQVDNHINFDKSFLKQQDLMVVSLNSWEKIIRRKVSWLPYIPSALIILSKDNRA